MPVAVAKSSKVKIRRLNTAGSWLPLGHKQTPPDLSTVLAAFGPPRFTDEEQAASPNEPKTRIVKDVLKVGRKVLSDGDAWDVTPATLASIAENYSRGQSLGYAANLGKTHGGEDGLIHPDDLIQPIDGVAVVGDTLWLSAYVTPEQCDYLCNNYARKVSIATLEPFQDGSGNTYPIQLVHVAVTDQPVDVGQGRFSKLAASPAQQKETTMDFAALKGAVNSLLSALGLPALGDDITEVNITDRLSGIAHALGTATPAATPENEGTEAPEMPDLDPAMMAKSPAIQKALSLALAPHVAGIKAELDSLKAEKVATAKQRFLSRTAEFGKAGMPGKRVEQLNAKGEKYNWDIELLDGCENEKGIDMRKLSKTLATAAAPEVPVESNGRATDEEVEARLLARGIKPNWKTGHKVAVKK